jgi:hypothetical protein
LRVIRLESAEVTPGLHGAAAEEESTSSLGIGGDGGEVSLIVLMAAVDWA